MKLIVDARPFSTVKRTGVARYVASISLELQRLGYELVFVSNRKIHLPDSLDPQKCVIVEYTLFKAVPGSLFIMLVFPIIAQRLKRFVFWGDSFAVPLIGGFRSIVTIHDLVPFEYPSTVTTATLIFGRLSIRGSLWAASTVSTVSEFTKQRIKHLFPGFDHHQISVIRCAVDANIFHRITDRLLIESKLSPIVQGKFILAVGSIEPRKNLESLIVAFCKLKESGYPGDLVLVGGQEWRSDKVRELINQSRYSSSIKFTGFIADELLNYFYNGCDLFVFPALYEGFGIPPLEAILAGAKTICSTSTEIPAIVGNNSAVTWFNPETDDLYSVIVACIQEGNHKTQKLVDLPQWNKSAEQLDLLISGLETKYQMQMRS